MNLTILHLASNELTTSLEEDFIVYEGKDIEISSRLKELIKVGNLVEVVEPFTVVITSKEFKASLAFKGAEELSLFLAAMPSFSVKQKKIMVVGPKNREPGLDLREFKVEAYAPLGENVWEREGKRKKPYYNRQRPF